MSHAYLTDVTDFALKREVLESKKRLEDICRQRIRSFSCPGGRFDQRLLPLALEAGYESVVTSRAVPNSRAYAMPHYGRIAIMRDTTLAEFDRIIRARGMRKRIVRDALLRAAKSLLGNDGYERLRGHLLGRTSAD